MSTIGQPERATQNRVLALFRDEIGYRYFGDWTDRDGNSNVEEGLLTAYLTRRCHSPAQIGKSLYDLRTEADNPTAASTTIIRRSTVCCATVCRRRSMQARSPIGTGQEATQMS